VQEIADWLEAIGLSEYAPRFAKNGINIAALRYLTDQDLKDIDVLLGHRRIILAAIDDELEPGAKGTAASALTSAAPSIAAASPVSITENVGERRHVTVMFCDLVDSTSMAARLDAEEWRDLVGAYVDAGSTAVAEMEGKIAKKLGDGLMALFGYPVAQENDAERAVRAALSIQRALAELNRKNEGTGKPALAARIAIDSGPVVVDATGEIFGDVPNVAARAQAVAEGGSVVVTARVQRQVAGLFVAEDRGSHELKGVPEPITLYRIARASGGGRRAGQRHLTPLFGREEEIALLMRRWGRARKGDGQLILIVGEPGIGKSRLIEEFHARLRDTPHTWIEWSCSQLLQNTPLHPIAETARMRFGGSGLSAAQRLAELENSLAQVKLDPVENASLLASLLDIPLPSKRVPALAPQELRRRQLAALTAWVLAGARAQVLVLAVEDAHWADPTTLDLLRGIAERGAPAPLFVLIAARPEFRPAWGTRSHHGTISLGPLDHAQVRDMVAELSARHALTREVVNEVAARTGGVPLFVEEVTRLLLERGEHGGIHAIPPTLQQSLMARLDRLGPAREVAQIGAAIGREFSYALLAAVVGKPKTELGSALDRLIEAGLLFRHGVSPHTSYLFNHSLVQDAAYGTLLRETRRTLHARIAETLESHFTDIVKSHPELLARHCIEAGLVEKAALLWGKAGQRSLERSAFKEAAEHLTRALNQIDTLPSTPALRREQIKLQVALIAPLMSVKGASAPETKAAAERAHLLLKQAEALGEPLEEPELLFSVLDGFAAANFLAFNGDAMGRIAEQFLALAEKQEATVPRLIGHRIMGMTVLHTGNIAQGRAHYDQALALGGQLTTRLHFSELVQTLSLRSFALWLLGHPEAALMDLDNALRDARKIGHANDLLYALLFGAWFHTLCDRNYEAAKAVTNELVALGDKTGAVAWRVQGMINHGCVLAVTGKFSEAVQLISSGLSARKSIGATVTVPSFLSYLAIGHMELRGFNDAWRCIDEALATIETTKETWFEAEVHRVAGELALKSAKSDRAKAACHFEKALAVARDQQAKSWELRSAMSMARLWRDQGKREEARDLLAPVYGWFTEGFDTLDLKEAKVLLEELAA
jgi:class 3 adenylate cyclase/predicted ATPase